MLHRRFLKWNGQHYTCQVTKMHQAFSAGWHVALNRKSSQQAFPFSKCIWRPINQYNLTSTIVLQLWSHALFSHSLPSVPGEVTQHRSIILLLWQATFHCPRTSSLGSLHLINCVVIISWLLIFVDGNSSLFWLPHFQIQPEPSVIPMFYCC